MILALALAIVASASAVAAPWGLRGVAALAPPIATIAAWLAAIVSVLGSGLAAVAVGLWPGHAPGELTLEAWMRCLSTVEHSIPAPARGFLWGGVLGIGAVLLARLVVVGVGDTRARTKLSGQYAEMVRLLGRADPQAARLYWLEHPVPLAFSVAGRHRYVVATDGLAERLTPRQRSAVLAHEHAHLRGFHHQITGLCRILAAAFPRIPLFAAAPGAIAALVELAADRSAARVIDPLSMRTALGAVASVSPASPGLAGPLVDESLELRMNRLRADAPAVSALPAVMAWVGAVATGMAVAGLAIAGVAIVACLGLA
ncbi:M56 family metallopeptidase [Nocardia takedensis]|uniref:M56 family metallopeptidase n=1 Tax=Nocardia TaxID=1817 RepID=UPI0002E89DA8|nr:MULTISPECIES: M56 family metallopeptidase [Nocardia]